MRLPDFEAWAIFAAVAEARSFTAAAERLALSKGSVSKAVSRLETHLGQSLFHRTSRRLALTEAGRTLADHAARIVAEAHAAEEAARDAASIPTGRIRMAAPMSFGVANVAPLVADFLVLHPGVEIELDLSDARVDIVAEGYDVALRIGDLADSSLRGRRLCDIATHIVAAPAYLAGHGTPMHAADLARHSLLGYANLSGPWRFLRAGEAEVSIRPRGPLTANSGDALVPALLAGLGIARLPGFIVGPHVAAGTLVEILADWTPPPTGLHLLTPPSTLRPARVEALIAFLGTRLRDPCTEAPSSPPDPKSSPFTGRGTSRRLVEGLSTNATPAAPPCPGKRGGSPTDTDRPGRPASVTTLSYRPAICHRPPMPDPADDPRAATPAPLAAPPPASGDDETTAGGPQHPADESAHAKTAHGPQLPQLVGDASADATAISAPADRHSRARARLAPDADDARFLRRLVLLVVVAAVVAALYRASNLLILAFGAILGALVIHAVADLYRHRLGAPRKAALPLGYATVLGIIGILVWLFGVEFRQQVNTLVTELPGMLGQLAAWAGRSPVGEKLVDAVRQAYAGSRIAQDLGSIVEGGGEMLLNAVLLLVGALFFAADPKVYERGFLLLVPPPHRPAFEDALFDVGQTLRLWLRSSLILMTSMGVLIGAGLWLAGVPSAATLGLLAGLSEFIPYVGPTAAMIPALGLAATVGTGPVLGALATYAVVRLIQTNFITPYVQQRVIAIPPAITVFAIIGIGVVFGIFGLFFSAALLVVIFTLVRSLYLREVLGEPIPRSDHDAIMRAPADPPA